ncbi:MAG: HlyC/CorC family transporter [Proteobacteria bacterium]|nr:HlyC/CorC family transporter [Pseudomonadota bacterium]
MKIGTTLPHEDGAGRGAAIVRAILQATRGWFHKLRRSRNGENSIRETLEELIEEREESEIPINADERVLIENILSLQNVTVKDEMVPRAEVVAVEADTTLPDLIELMSRTAHSRLPVYRETLDDVIGMVHIKDVLACSGGNEPGFISEITRKVLFVAPTMRVLDLLLQMRLTRVHMALVVDEYGGIDGLVTIEDLVEGIVGEIQDEHDVEPPALIEHPDGSIIADARVKIEEFEEKLGPVLTPEEREEDIDSLGGLVFSIIGRVPGRGEVIHHASGLEFEVIDADPRRIKRLRLRNLPQTAPATTASPPDKPLGGTNSLDSERPGDQ